MIRWMGSTTHLSRSTTTKSYKHQTKVMYLGLTFDKRLTRSSNLKRKRKQVNSRPNLLGLLLKSKLSLTNKVTIQYKVIIHPVWLHGIQLWACAKPSNTKTLQSSHSICQRRINSTSWHVTNKNLHKDLKLPTLNDKSHYIKIFFVLYTIILWSTN